MFSRYLVPRDLYEVYDPDFFTSLFNFIMEKDEIRDSNYFSKFIHFFTFASFVKLEIKRMTGYRTFFSFFFFLNFQRLHSRFDVPQRKSIGKNVHLLSHSHCSASLPISPLRFLSHILKLGSVRNFILPNSSISINYPVPKISRLTQVRAIPDRRAPPNPFTLSAK